MWEHATTNLSPLLSKHSIKMSQIDNFERNGVFKISSYGNFVYDICVLNILTIKLQ